MIWLGVAPAVVTAFGVLAAATIIWLARRSQRSLAVPVAFAELWQKVLANQRTELRRHKLRRTLVILLQLLFLASALLLAADLRREQPDEVKQVWIVDTSMSMQAGGQLQPTVSPELIEALTIAAAALPDDVEVALISTNQGPDFLRWHASAGELRQALQTSALARSIAPELGQHSRALALARARALAAATPANLLLFSDFGPESASAENAATSGEAPIVQSIVIGQAHANHALLHASLDARADQPGRLHAMAVVVYYGQSTQAVRLDIFGRDASGREVLLSQTNHDLAANLATTLQIDNLPDTYDSYRIHVDGAPAENFRIDDDEIQLALPVRQHAKVLIVSDAAELFLRAGILALDSQVQLTTATAKEVANQPELLAEQDLVIFSKCSLPEQVAAGPRIVVALQPQNLQTIWLPAVKRDSYQRPVGVQDEANSPIHFSRANFSELTTYRISAPLQTLASYVDQPFVAHGHAAGRDLWLLGIALDQTDLIMRNEFLVLLDDWLRTAAPEKGVSRSSLTGATLPRIDLATSSRGPIQSSRTVFLAAPDKSWPATHAGDQLLLDFAPLDARLTQAPLTVYADDQTEFAFSLARGDAFDSDLRQVPAPTATTAQTWADGYDRKSKFPLDFWQIVATLAALLLAAEYCVRSRAEENT